jgi:ATP-dependent helicase/nuclease subunit A
LEVLPALPPEDRSRAGERLLTNEAGELPEPERADMLRIALDLMEEGELAPIFGPEADGEVGIQGQIDGQTISGEIDRLAVLPDRIICAEFKTTRWLPKSAEDIPTAHRTQAELYRRLLSELYPDRTVEALLVYTAGPRIFTIGTES